MFQQPDRLSEMLPLSSPNFVDHDVRANPKPIHLAWLHQNATNIKSLVNMRSNGDDNDRRKLCKQIRLEDKCGPRLCGESFQ